MIQITVTRNQLGLEDLLVGEGVVEQVRMPGQDLVPVTRINAMNFPYNNTMTLAVKLQELEDLANSLSVVDTEGNFLTGYLNTSEDPLNLAGRLWRKTPEDNPGVAELYYGSVRILQYNETTGDLVLPPDTDYIAADAVLKTQMEEYTDAVQDNLNELAGDLRSGAFTNHGTGANELVKLNGEGRLPALDARNLTDVPDSIPVGVISYTAASTPDAKHLECAGQLLSRTTYAALFARIGTKYGVGDGVNTFNLPDARGEFIRNLDSGRGVDSGRVYGTYQEDMFKAHSHKQFTYYSYTATGSGYSFSGVHASNSADTSTVGGSETRPRNIAFLCQIKVLP